jgi:hypothetical protein
MLFLTFLLSGRVVVEAPGQLDEHAGLVAYRPGVMPRRQHHDVVRTKLILGPIHDTSLFALAAHPGQSSGGQVPRRARGP